MILYTAIIEGNPITKKNSQRIIQVHGRPMILPSKAYTDYEAKARFALKKPPEPICERVTVRCIYYMATARKCDLTNLLEATHDILVKHRVLADDNSNIIASVDGSRVCIDRSRPRVEITIERAEE